MIVFRDNARYFKCIDTCFESLTAGKVYRALKIYPNNKQISIVNDKNFGAKYPIKLFEETVMSIPENVTVVSVVVAVYNKGNLKNVRH